MHACLPSAYGLACMPAPSSCRRNLVAHSMGTHACRHPVLTWLVCLHAHPYPMRYACVNAPGCAHAGVPATATQDCTLSGGKHVFGIWGRCMSVCIVAPSWCRLNLHSIVYFPCLCTCACITAHPLLHNFASGEEFMSHGLEKRLELGTHVCIWGVRRNVTTNLLC